MKVVYVLFFPHNKTQIMQTTQNTKNEYKNKFQNVQKFEI